MPASQLKIHKTLIDVTLFLCLLVLLGLYINGQWLTAQLSRLFGDPPPVFIQLALPQVWQTWLWSIDSISVSSKVALIVATLGGGLLALGLQWWTGWLSWIEHWRSPWFHLVVALLTIPFLWYLRGDIGLGDAPRYTAMLGTGRLFVMHGPLASLLFALVHRLGGSRWPPESTVAFVNCLLGAVWVYLLLRFASRHEGWKRWLLLGCVLPASGVAIFFGYREMMALALVAAVVYLYLATGTLNGQSLYLPSLALSLAIAAHGQMLLLLPSYGILLLATWYKGQRRVILPALMLVPLPSVILLAVAFLRQDLIIGGLYGDALGGADGMFVSLFRTGGEYEHYTLFSVEHIIELINAMLVTAPFALILLVPALFAAWRRRREWEVWLLATVAVGAILFIFLWNADLGMQNDWDLFTPPFLLLLLSSALLWPSEIKSSSGKIWIGLIAGFSLAVLIINVYRFAPIKQWDPYHIVLRQIDVKQEANFGGVAELLGYKLLGDTYVPGESLSLTLFWRLRQSTEIDYTAGVYIIQTDGADVSVLAQEDHRPVTWYRYFSEWHVGEIVGDSHVITLPGDLQPGTYEIWLTLYELTTLERLVVDEAANLDYLKLVDVLVVNAQEK